MRISAQSHITHERQQETNKNLNEIKHVHKKRQQHTEPVIKQFTQNIPI